jgi:hypothetical protein
MAKSTKKKVTFESCDKAFMENNFGLSQVNEIPELTAWVSSKIAVTEFEKEVVLNLLDNTKRRIDDWNEEGLKMNFIAPLLSYVKFNSEKYTAFADEKFEAEVGDYFLTGKLDWFVAKGIYKPETPIFFLQEFKRGKGNPSDPDGQILAEMLASRTLNNQEDEVMYGVVIIGKNWNLIVLKGTEYALSNTFDSKNIEDLIEIFEILKASKKIIEQKIEVLEAKNPIKSRL